MTPQPHLTILFDNEPGLPGLTSLWGFAALIRLEGRTVLFDTGSNGRVLLRNMAALGLSPESVDLLFLSHPHWDHMGGLDSFLECNPAVTVALHEGFSKHLIHDLHSQCGELIVIGAEPRLLAPGIFSTGMLDSQPPEHGMVIDAGGVTAAIAQTHPGLRQRGKRQKHPGRLDRCRSAAKRLSGDGARRRCLESRGARSSLIRRGRSEASPNR
jgi:7,8-dihydropterin-6-yl-methyl-4-(beta-D-ribofuranosyl)aminobenzene 5'-phosphate synthase